MGFLDKKQRIIDTLLTPYGRKMLANGGLNISFIAASDKGSMYKKDENNVRDDDFIETGFESFSSFEDQIFFISSKKGNLLSEKVQEEISYKTGDFTINSDGIVYTTDTFAVSNNEFVSNIENIITGSHERILNKKYLKNKANNEYDNFLLDKNKVDFYISRNSPIQQDDLKEIDVDAAEPLFFDKFVSNTDSFLFLPPVILPGQGSTSPTPLGEYTDLNQENIESYDNVRDMLDGKQFKEIIFEENSRDSNIVMQMYEVNKSSGQESFSKLDTIDFQEFYDEGSFKKVIFAGKVLVDSYGYPTYINMFTIVMEE